MIMESSNRGAKMYIIDVNTSFGKRVDSDPRFSIRSLLSDMDLHAVACALTYSQQGIEYDPREGNRETLAATRANPRLLPVGTLDPRASLCWETELELCLKHGVRAMRFSPRPQDWSVSSYIFKHMLRRMSGSGLCLIFSPAEAALMGWELYGEVARATAEAGLPVIFVDAGYASLAEAIAVMWEFPHVHIDTNLLTSVDAVEIVVEAVGASRLLHGSAAPGRSMQKSLNHVLETGLSDQDKSAILGGNAMRLLHIAPETLAGCPQPADLQPKGFSQEIIDVHSHLGQWRFPLREENYDPSAMLRRMKRYGITRSVLSSYESMRYDIAEGNRKLAAAIEGHPELLGYVELNPYQLELSCAEMDKYYRLPNFAGAELELHHIPCSAASPKVRALMAEVAKRGRPILFIPDAGSSAQAERELARLTPNLAIIHAHGFDAEWARVVADTPNICVEFNRSFSSHYDVRDGVDILGPQRVFFGSDQTLLGVGSTIGVYLDARLTETERRLVLSENARRIFKV
jgi:predicted TIM-barrel fold metal-dependent hydrolase